MNQTQAEAQVLLHDTLKTKESPLDGNNFVPNGNTDLSIRNAIVTNKKIQRLIQI